MMLHRLLCTTGSKLVPDKCFWYLVNFKWQNQQWKYKNNKELPGQINVTINQNKHITIPRLETSKVWRTLGIQLALDGNDNTKAQYLQEVAAEWARNMARANLNWADAEFSLCQILASKLIYPLIATNLSEEQCYNIMKPVLASCALLAMGINRHFPWAVVHGPRSHQGLDIPNLFTEQLCAHIMTLLRFGSQPHDPTGHLIQVNVEAFQLEAGLAGDIFLMPIGIYKYMMMSWFTKTWYHCGYSKLILPWKWKTSCEFYSNTVSMDTNWQAWTIVACFSMPTTSPIYIYALGMEQPSIHNTGMARQNASQTIIGQGWRNPQPRTGTYGENT